MKLGVNFIVTLFLNTFFTMCMIYAIKYVSGRFNIPIVKDVAESI